MHTIISLKQLIQETINTAPSQISDRRGYNKSVRSVNQLRECVKILEAGINKDMLELSKSSLVSKIEACLNRIDRETSKYKSINKQVPSKVIRSIKEDFGYSTALNQLKTINFILNEKSVQ